MQDSERAQEAKCGLCGEPMPEGEEMFKFHGYSGGCPKPPLAEVAKYLGSMLAVDPPPSGASPQATGGYIHHSLTDWIPTPGCDCDRCTSARKSAPKPVEPEPCVWRAIATVPKDGTRILLTPAVWTAGRVVSAYYRLGMWWIESADARGSIRAFTDPDEDASHWPFTHWTPLPGAPLKVEREP